jgi:hypothetical protein
MIAPQTQRYMAQRMKSKTKAHAVDHTPSVTDRRSSWTLFAMRSAP